MNAAAREVEAILLVSGRPVPARALAAATGRAKEEVEEAVGVLEERYSPESSGIVLRRVGGGFQFATNPAASEAVERSRKEARPSPLSAAAHEVLSCVLYLGPMTRAAVAKVRGVNSDAVVRSLIERGLLAESGFDADSPGTPALLDLTEEFHIASGSSARSDFPPLESLVSEEELDRVRDRIVAPEPPGETPPGETPPGGEGSAPPREKAPGDPGPSSGEDGGAGRPHEASTLDTPDSPGEAASGEGRFGGEVPP
ncbi:MAG: SMC-Scp complex subunit ScpB [Rubrobacter sp.]|nr:SMC-Scp complex subunit ScpB [Rubrobacter sp.]